MRTVASASGHALAALAGSIVVLVVLWFPVSAGATTYTVNTPSDVSTLPCPSSHQCSLRQAIAAVNASPSPPDVINVPAGAYQLSQSGGLVISQSVAVVGAGSATTTVNGGGVGVGRVFQFNQTSGPLTVTMSGLTITNGNPGNASGGGIETNATASLTDVVVTGNTASGSGGGIDNSGSLTLTNSTVSKNVLTGTSSAAGGGINNSTRLTLDHVTVSGNSSAGEGGGIESSGFAPNGLFATDVSVSDNTAAAGAGSGGGGLRISANAILTRVTVLGNSALTTNSVGGGIYNSALSPDAFSVTDSTISGNSQGAGTGGEGGSGGAGIFNSGDSASLTRVTVSSNFAGSGESGGGLYNTGTLALTDVTVGGNTLGANSWGAGIYNSGNPFTANRVTISDNSAGPAGQGGGVFNTGSSSGGALVQLTNVTISDNSLGTGGTGAGLNSSGFGVAITNATIAGNTIASGTNGGGVWTLGTTAIQNSIVAANTANNCGGGTLTSAGHNIASDGSCGFGAAGDIITANPGLKLLAANGGPTQTRALAPGSPAIDAGNDGSCPTVDQRGVSRPQLAHCDIGAYEYSPPVASAAVPACVASCVVTFTVTATPGGSPPTAVHYVLDGGPEQVLATSGNPGTASITVPAGTHALVYWGESLGGDLELVHHSATVAVSAIPGVSSGAPKVLSTTSAAFSATVNPEGLVTNVVFQYGPALPASRDLGRVLGRAAAPITYTATTPSQSVGPDFSDHVVTASVTGLLPNTAYHVRVVATNSAGGTTGPDQTLTTPADPPPPPPVLGKSFDASVVSGLVLVKLPHGQPLYQPDVGARDSSTLTTGVGFVPLTEARRLPVGTQVDTRRGTIKLIAATGQRRKTQTGTFSQGLFGLSQARRGNNKGLTTLALLEGAFPGAPTYASCKARKADDGSRPSGHAALASTTLQLLRASAHGRFRTSGRYSAATVRGTVWTISDRCDGTLTSVRRGTVLVTDLVRRINVTVHAGHRYLARAP